MSLAVGLTSYDGFTVESPDGCLGWVEETWLDAQDRPAALAIRTPDGRCALLTVDTIEAADPDAQEVIVPAGIVLQGLEPPRLERLDGQLSASWRASGTVKATPTTAHASPSAPVLTAARSATVHSEPPLLRTLLVALVCLAALVAFEIALAFGIAYLVTGRLT
jgi:hypothetical protein